jgi:putative transposase
MARRSRLNLAGVPQHIIQRGNNRQPTFFAEEDFGAYLHWLAEAATKYGCRIYAYVLMTNHVHLLASTEQSYGLSLMMQYVGRHFVRYINRVYHRTGGLWEGRFKSSLVDTDTYFFRCCRYIECNPVRAQMVKVPAEYRWSSYRSHAFGVPDKLLSVHEQYERLGADAEERHRAYRELFSAELASAELAQIRDTANQGWPLGSDRFKDEIERALSRVARPPRLGRPVRSKQSPQAKQDLAHYRLEKLH